MKVNQDKRLLFRGCSRLCPHAPSSLVAESALASATAAARASQGAGMEGETSAANQAAEANIRTLAAEKKAAGAENRLEKAENLLRRQGFERAKLMVREGMLPPTPRARLFFCAS